MDQEKIGDFIKDLREKNNLTQEELAAKMYVSRSNLSDIENGKTMLSPDKALILGKIFNISIMDIYAGEKIDNNNKELVNKTFDNVSSTITKKVKTRYKKILLLMSSVILLLLISFLCYYFFYSYNSVKVYKVSGESDNFFTNNGMLIMSKENIYFSLNINSKNDEEIKYISLRYKDNDKDELIQQVDDNYFYIIDFYNYNAYFDYETIIKERGSYYVEVEYEDKKEQIDLNILKQYENKNLVFKKDKPITDDSYVDLREEVKIPDKILKEFTFEHNSFNYHKKLKKFDLHLGYVPDASLFIVAEEYRDYYSSWEYFIDSNELYYSQSDYEYNVLEKERIVDSKNDAEMYSYFFNNYFNKYFK